MQTSSVTGKDCLQLALMWYKERAPRRVSSAPEVCGATNNYHEMPFTVSELFYSPSGALVGSRLVIEFVV